MMDDDVKRYDAKEDFSSIIQCWMHQIWPMHIVYFEEGVPFCLKYLIISTTDTKPDFRQTLTRSNWVKLNSGTKIWQYNIQIKEYIVISVRCSVQNKDTINKTSWNPWHRHLKSQTSIENRRTAKRIKEKWPASMTNFRKCVKWPTLVTALLPHFYVYPSKLHRSSPICVI